MMSASLSGGAVAVVMVAVQAELLNFVFFLIF